MVAETAFPAVPVAARANGRLFAVRVVARAGTATVLVPARAIQRALAVHHAGGIGVVRRRKVDRYPAAKFAARGSVPCTGGLRLVVPGPLVPPVPGDLRSVNPKLAISNI